jgi:hypothetical protein
MKMPPIVSKLKEAKTFSVALYMLRDRLFAVLLSLALSIFSSTLSVM